MPRRAARSCAVDLVRASSRNCGRSGSPCGVVARDLRRDADGSSTRSGLTAMRCAKPVSCEPPSNDPVNASPVARRRRRGAADPGRARQAGDRDRSRIPRHAGRAARRKRRVAGHGASTSTCGCPLRASAALISVTTASCRAPKADGTIGASGSPVSSARNRDVGTASSSRPA